MSNGRPPGSSWSKMNGVFLATGCAYRPRSGGKGTSIKAGVWWVVGRIDTGGQRESAGLRRYGSLGLLLLIGQ